MDAISDPRHDRVVIMSSAQVGKTEILNNCIGYSIHLDACPMLVLQPTLDMAETWSKDRLMPMVRDTPVLTGRIADPRARDSGNTLLHKMFPGGHVTIVGANSAAGLASRPIRKVFADEVDRYPPSAGAEGDPISLAIKRTSTFWNRRIVMASTPTIKGVSRIEAEFLQSDQRLYFCRCEHCNEFQHLVWKRVRWPEGKPEEAQYFCEHCGAAWSEADRLSAIKHGEWRATNPEGAFAGFHLNELYSPWKKPAEIAVDFIAAKRSPETLKTWVNTSLGEPWEEDAESVDSHALMARCEDFGDAVPAGVVFLTCGVDVQVDRLELEVVGWGLHEESWSVAFEVMYGDPSGREIWQQLDEFLARPWTRADGRQLVIQATCVDSGGHHTLEVYAFCGARLRRRVWAIKGMGGPGKPLWPLRASKPKKGNTPMFSLGVDAGKEAVYSRLKITEPGPGYCHFPLNRDVVWFEQLTAEVIQTKYFKGFPVRQWVLPSGKRNEALDCRVYAMAAMLSLKPRWDRMAPKSKAQAEDVEAPKPAPKRERLDPLEDMRAPEPTAAEATKRQSQPRQSRRGMRRSKWV